MGCGSEASVPSFLIEINPRKTDQSPFSAEWSGGELVSSSLPGRRILWRDEPEPRAAPTDVDSEGDGQHLRAKGAEAGLRLWRRVAFQAKPPERQHPSVGEQHPCLSGELALGGLLPHRQEPAGLQLPEPQPRALLVF